MDRVRRAFRRSDWPIVLDSLIARFRASVILRSRQKIPTGQRSSLDRHANNQSAISIQARHGSKNEQGGALGRTDHSADRATSHIGVVRPYFGDRSCGSFFRCIRLSDNRVHPAGSRRLVEDHAWRDWLVDFCGLRGTAPWCHHIGLGCGKIRTTACAAIQPADYGCFCGGLRHGMELYLVAGIPSITRRRPRRRSASRGDLSERVH